MPSVAYTTPGVYIEEDASLSLSISSSPTAIPVFIGKFFRKDGRPIEQGSCIKITSWLDFTSQFSFSPVVSIKAEATKVEPKPEPKPKPEPEFESELKSKTTELKDIQRIAVTEGSDSLEKDKKKGEEKEVKYTYTYVATVTATSLSAFAVQHYFNNGGGICYLLPLVATEAGAATTELATLPDLIEKQQEITLLLCAETDTTLVNCMKQDVYNAINSLLQKKVGYFLIADSKDGTNKPTTQPDKTAVYYPDLETSFTYNQPTDADIVLSGYQGNKEVNTLADLNTDSPKEYKEEYEKAKKLAYDKWQAANVPTTPITLPPSAAVAGAYAATDASRGVWKAPANVALNNAKPNKVITDDKQGAMNKAGINAIRHFTGKGTLIWGARTLKESDDWCYIPVRRLFNSAERDIKQAMQVAVFEPNSQPTWERVRSAIDNYLHQLWQQGALVGSNPQEAYFVQIGQGITMSETDIRDGKMIVKVGMAAVRPAEFIILQFSQNVAQ
ncbi:phage tail sheath family protein [Photorhabdus heterorhabditis]|uniref:phage tail sheath family protein n=1 Tax=Photorhabdus heterorhabditis TaxID=880156 RepID=UPI001561C600|nr:phage tail sheath C-terminal domain-containing protein [Photorhabdus heterorhabditis]NRN27590.1 phage tail sheath family protein [Photorhabdus heterorhabditis subsp. aluminescens]